MFDIDEYIIYRYVIFDISGGAWDVDTLSISVADMRRFRYANRLTNAAESEVIKAIYLSRHPY